MRRMLLLSLLLLTGSSAFTQVLTAKNGLARFYSHTPLEDIKAENRQVLVKLDPNAKTIQLALLQKGFLFEKALMQSHFNENYMESDKFPKAEFQGTFDPAIDLAKQTSQAITVKGKLAMHGVTRDLSVPANITVKGGSITGEATFQIKPEDYNISIPALVREKIAPNIEVTISFELKQP